MSYSLTVKNGDLVFEGSRLGIVTGTRKIKQELSIWLTERYQCDRFHPKYGSVLDDFVGSSIDRTTSVRIQSEVSRVINNYRKLKMESYSANPDKFTFDELLDNFDITVAISYDSVVITIAFTTASGLADTITHTTAV